jgi:hypothetical protein
MTIFDSDEVPACHIELGIAKDGSCVIVKFPPMDIDGEGRLRILFDLSQAREFARLLVECADECDIAQIPRC